MSKTLKQQVGDALYYLNKPGLSREDEAKAVEILSHIAYGKKSAAVKLEAVKTTPLPYRIIPEIPSAALKDKQIAIVVGHEPGGGAEGERKFNILVAREMTRILTDAGAVVFNYQHRTRKYSQRMAEMKRAIGAAQSNNFACFELHYDAYKPNPSASGHHFQYRGAKQLAEAVRDEWQSQYPQSVARRQNGIMRNMDKNGSGFLRATPGWAILTETVFRTNRQEWDFFKTRYNEIAQIYCIGLARFAELKTG